MKLLNAFSINMFEVFPASLFVKKISLGEVLTLFRTNSMESYVGHSETAALFSAQLGGITIATNRATIHLQKGESAVVGQYRGPRLPEGATTLPIGATIEWYMVEIN